ncbi:poly-gamma-glutamate hydrolase family protein [Staphylococcus capitis]|uniref:poly-gamma-glutamate hydrolase family protein n=2 Tax=Staphylococcus capitis TaxID=29388 RepID=UPI00217551B8|nr:poly-gamma-glutamate hydrolase family protein [Staphylococcus capitis]
MSTSSKMKLSILICLVILIIGITSACAITHEHKHSATHHLKLHHVPLIVGQGEDKGQASTVNLEPSESAQEDVHHKDRFKSMTDLFKHTKRNVDWKKEVKKVGSHVLIIAPHGGNIEAGTTELTKLIANDNHYDYFSFTVLRKKHAEDLHVTSSHCNDPTLLNMVKSKDYAVSIHGAKGDKPVIYLGGLDTPLKESIKKQLVKHHFVVKIAPTYLGGDLKENFINEDIKGKGVQLELTTALRKSLFVNEKLSAKSRINRSNWSPAMYRFSDAIDKAVQQVDESGKDR